MSYSCYLVYQWGQEDWFHRREYLPFKISVNGGVFSKQRLILSELFTSERLVLGVFHGRQIIAGLCGSTNAKLVCDALSLIVIVRARCPCRPPPRFDDTDAAFPLHNWCSSMSPSLVGSPPIFGRIGVRKYARNPSMLVVAPTITSRALVGLDFRFVLWENSSNPLKC